MHELDEELLELRTDVLALERKLDVGRPEEIHLLADVEAALLEDAPIHRLVLVEQHGSRR